MKIEQNVSFLSTELQPGDQIRVRSTETQDVDIRCAPDGRIEVIVSGLRPAHQAVVVRLSDVPLGGDLAPILRAARKRQK